MSTVYSLAAVAATLATVAGCIAAPNPCQGPVIRPDGGAPIYTDPGYGCQDDPSDGGAPKESP